MNLYDQILGTELPTVINPNFRKESRKTWAQGVRALFKSLGFKGISVTAPNYSMASSIRISFPSSGCQNPIHNEPYSRYLDCALCAKERAAKQKAVAIILAAFPDLDNRSDSQTDHFDYCLSVN